jgi:hypothetical protein
MTTPRPIDPKAAHAPQDLTPDDLEERAGHERPETGMPTQRPPEADPEPGDGTDAPDAADIEEPERQL